MNITERMQFFKSVYELYSNVKGLNIGELEIVLWAYTAETWAQTLNCEIRAIKIDRASYY